MASPSYVPIATSLSAPSKGMVQDNRTVYLDSAPYPEVEGPGDAETLALLKEDYGGGASEITAVIQYFYQNTRITNDEALSNALLQTAMVEMQHLDMLGDAIQALGGNPTLGNGKVYWQGGLVDYTQNLADMMEADAAAEANTIAIYDRQASQVKNESVKRLLLRLAQDEKLHLRFFQEALAKMSKPS